MTRSNVDSSSSKNSSQNSPNHPNRYDAAVLKWLKFVIFTLILLIAVGGITRLTISGLSITEWNPIMGAIPPITDQDWNIEFEKYRQTPQFDQLNTSMDIDGFKRIFFWEYLHRLIARSIGLIVLLPLIFFAIKKAFSPRWTKRFIFLFCLGGFQGFLGWFMVKSGLVSGPFVSHFRLSIHLVMAFFILAVTYWYRLDWEHKTFRSGLKSLSPFSVIVAFFYVLQITLGAWVAGLKAGFGYNFFPFMNAEHDFLSGDAWSMTPLLQNFFFNPAMIQFLHRWVGVGFAVIGTVYVIVNLKRNPTKAIRSATIGFVGVVWSQVLIGILTLLSTVRIELAAIHQITAAVILLSMCKIQFLTSRQH